MNKRTPGPWQFACDSGHSTPCLRGVQHSKKAVVYSKERTIASHIANWDDARLIAAAPELLAAVRALLDMVTDNRTHGPEINRAVAVIDRAEGREA